MSGIAAILSPRSPIRPEALDRAVDRLRHRGPDQSARWISERGDVGLGQALLAHLDPGGELPIASEDGQIRLVAGGSFYGTGALRRELEGRGHRLRTRSDAEVVAHLYEERGVDCLEALRGEFAFALWDARDGLLFAARDRFGAKPLFYARRGETLYLASEAKALFAAGIAAAWDHETVYQQLFVNFDDDRSFFAGVHQVPPGHFLLASRHHLRIVKYWDLDYPETPSPLPEEEAKAELRRRLEEAVRLRMESDHRVGFFLSGGIDSSTVLALGAAQTSEKVRAFTVSFSDEGYDEAEAARQAAERVGAEFDLLRITSGELADHLSDAVWHSEMPGLNAHGVARYLHSRVVREAGYRAVISGEGSDDVLGGYPSSKADALGDGTPAPGAEAMLGHVHRQLGFTPAWMNKVCTTRSIFHALMAADYAAEFEGRDPYRVFLGRCEPSAQLAGRERVIQSLYLWSRAFLGGYALCAERLAMAFSVEERVPFMDHHLFELIRTFPASLLVQDGREKYVLREMARPLVPESTYRRRKHSFSAPPSLGESTNRLDELIQDTLRGPVMDAIPFFDRGAVVALLDQLPALDASTRAALDPVFMIVVCLCCLHDRYRLGGA